MTIATEQRILEKLEKIEKGVEEIREHMVDADVVLSEEERKLLDDSVKNEKEGRLVSLREFQNVRSKAR